MDEFEDDDIFEISDDEAQGQSISSHNPIDDCLIKQLNEIGKSIARVENEISDVQSTCKKILAKLYKQSQFLHDYDSSDSDSEWFDASGRPIVKEKKKKCPEPEPILTVIDVWQRIVDDKWIIGAELQNHSDRTLQKPAFYITVRGETELRGLTSVWNMNNQCLWDRTANFFPEAKKIMATAVLNIPNFQANSVALAYGTIIYYVDGSELQTPIGSIELTAAQTVGKSLTPRYAQNLSASILAIKAMSIEKIITIPLDQESGRAARLLHFFARNDFLEVMPDVHMSKNPETFRHCIFEILSLADTRVKLRISTKSTSQLNIILLMIGEEFPDVAETAKEDKNAAKVIALEREIQLKLECDDPVELLNARIATDLLIP